MEKAPRFLEILRMPALFGRDFSLLFVGSVRLLNRISLGWNTLLVYSPKCRVRNNVTLLVIYSNENF